MAKKKGKKRGRKKGQYVWVRNPITGKRKLIKKVGYN